jgi:hypothetical protein
MPDYSRMSASARKFGEAFAEYGAARARLFLLRGVKSGQAESSVLAMNSVRNRQARFVVGHREDRY